MTKPIYDTSGARVRVLGRAAIYNKRRKTHKSLPKLSNKHHNKGK